MTNKKLRDGLPSRKITGENKILNQCQECSSGFGLEGKSKKMKAVYSLGRTNYHGSLQNVQPPLIDPHLSINRFSFLKQTALYHLRILSHILDSACQEVWIVDHGQPQDGEVPFYQLFLWIHESLSLSLELLPKSCFKSLNFSSKNAKNFNDILIYHIIYQFTDKIST